MILFFLSFLYFLFLYIHIDNFSKMNWIISYEFPRVFVLDNFPSFIGMNINEGNRKTYIESLCQAQISNKTP